MDTANINRVIDLVKAEPKAFEMVAWARSKDPYASSADVIQQLGEASGPVCGTAACLGGWMHALALRDAKKGDPRYMGRNLDSSDDLLSAFLGIERHKLEQTTQGLFNMGTTPNDRRLSMSRFDGLPASKRAEAGVRALELFRDTGNPMVWKQATEETGIYDQVVVGLQY